MRGKVLKAAAGQLQIVVIHCTFQKAKGKTFECLHRKRNVNRIMDLMT